MLFRSGYGCRLASERTLGEKSPVWGVESHPPAGPLCRRSGDQPAGEVPSCWPAHSLGADSRLPPHHTRVPALPGWGLQAVVYNPQGKLPQLGSLYPLYSACKYPNHLKVLRPWKRCRGFQLRLIRKRVQASEIVGEFGCFPEQNPLLVRHPTFPRGELEGRTQ